MNGDISSWMEEEQELHSDNSGEALNFYMYQFQAKPSSLFCLLDINATLRQELVFQWQLSMYNYWRHIEHAGRLLMADISCSLCLCKV